MIDSIGNGFGGTNSPINYNPDVQNAINLLKRISDEELVDIHAKVIAEQNRRLEETEKKLASRKKAFGRLGNPSAAPTAPGSRTRNNKPARSAGNGNGKRRIVSRGSRAPRGKAKGLILALLEDGPKSRRQIEAHFEGKGMPTKSVPTLLNRLKSDGAIGHDEENKLYSRKSRENDIHDSDEAPEKT